MNTRRRLRQRLASTGLAALAGLLCTSVLAAVDRIETGQEARPLALESSQGESFDLLSLRGDQNALLVFFRGTW